MNKTQKGVWAAILSNILFALLYLYSEWMKPVSGTAVFAWRMIGMFLTLWLLVLATHNWPPLFRTVARIVRRPKKRNWFLVTTALIASQFWLFMWGPVNGHGVDIAVGYFLFPIVMVCVGRVVFHERLNLLQWLAVLLAAAGVGNQLWHTHAFSWVTAWIIGTYPIYYFVRRNMKISALSGLLIDLTLIFPFALFYLWISGNFSLPYPSGKYWLLIPTLGLISAVAMHANLYAGFTLPVALFGIFSYLEPTLLFVLAVAVLGAPLKTEDLWTYLLIGSGIIVMLVNNYLALRKRSEVFS